MRFAVVTWATDQSSPRGQRAAHLITALSRHGNVERIGPQDVTTLTTPPPARPVFMASAGHHVGRLLVRHVLLDRSEPTAAWRLRLWSPQVDAAVLVGFPFAPLAYAARRLAGRNIPYVVDIGDPWALTVEGRATGKLQHSRALRAEHRVWHGARGAIVTTNSQAKSLVALFPHLKILIRPNGYEPEGDGLLRDGREIHERVRADELRLVHYGNLYAARLDASWLMSALAASGRWQKIVLRQHGDDWNDSLVRIGRHVEIEQRTTLPWPVVLREASQFDAVLAVGNRSADQLPSKAVQYLTLPIPRIALVNGVADALASYVADKPGWAVVHIDEPDPAARVARLVGRTWSGADLTAPSGESWRAVEKVLANFVLASIDMTPNGSAREDSPSRAGTAIGPRALDG
jgi:hypothetical protein